VNSDALGGNRVIFCFLMTIMPVRAIIRPRARAWARISNEQELVMSQQCPVCEGAGVVIKSPGAEPVLCENCNGTGLGPVVDPYQSDDDGGD